MTNKSGTPNRTRACASGVGIDRHIRVHDLRHTAASMALMKGIAGKVVQEMLGHSHYSTTMDIYSHVDPQMHREASKKMNAVLEG